MRCRTKAIGRFDEMEFVPQPCQWALSNFRTNSLMCLLYRLPDFNRFSIEHAIHRGTDRVCVENVYR